MQPRGRIYTPAPLAKHPLNEGRVLWLQGLTTELTGGPQWFDTARNNPGTLTNGPVWTPTPYGAGITAASGSSQMVDCGTPAGLNGATKAVLSAWVYKPDNSVTAGLGASGGSTGGGDRFSFFWYTDGTGYFSAENGSAAYGFVSIPVGWRRVCAAYDGTAGGNSTRLRVWVDGVPQTLSFTGTIPATLSSIVGPFTVGRDSSTRYCDGTYPDVSLWLGRAWSDADAALDFDQSLRGNPDTLRRAVPRVAVFSGAAAVTSAQQAYRFRDDDGSESTATWLAAENANISRDAGVATRLRVGVGYTGDPPATALKLQYRKVGDTTWKTVGN